jgi:hypothetical protein
MLVPRRWAIRLRYVLRASTAVAPDLSPLYLLPKVDSLCIYQVDKQVGPINIVLLAIEIWARKQHSQGHPLKLVELRCCHESARLFLEHMTEDGISHSVSWISEHSRDIDFEENESNSDSSEDSENDDEDSDDEYPAELSDAGVDEDQDDEM